MKYKLLKNNNQIIIHPVTGKEIRVYRIYALQDFQTVYGMVKANTTGGFIQSEENLPQEIVDASWVFNQGCVFDDAILIDSAVAHNAQVFGNAILKETLVTNQARIYGNVNIDDCEIKDKCRVSGTSRLTRTTMLGSSIAEGNCKLTDCLVTVGSRVAGDSIVKNTKLLFGVQVTGNTMLENCQYEGVLTIKNDRRLNEILAQYPDISIHNSPDLNK